MSPGLAKFAWPIDLTTNALIYALAQSGSAYGTTADKLAAKLAERWPGWNALFGDAGWDGAPSWELHQRKSSMRTSLALFIVIPLLFIFSACGEPRRFGDVGGVPVTVTVHIERAFVSGMENRQARPSVGAGGGFSSGGFSGVGVGVGLSFSSTQVYIVGGDNVGQANIFRQEIKWGDNTFTVPLAASRTLHLSVQVEGGRRGWEALPPVVVPPSEPAIAIVLDSNGAKLTVTPVVPAPAPAPATVSTPAKPAEPPATEPVKPAP